MNPYYERDGITIYHGDCLTVMAGLEAASVDTIITDPPYGLEFMGKDWDRGVPGAAFWEAALRVSKPGATLLAFGGTRTHHRLMCAIEDAGWEIRDCMMWLYGSGFPKSHDVSKAIDRAAGAEREIKGYVHSADKYDGSSRKDRHRFTGIMNDGNIGQSVLAPITSPATEAAQQWDGWGTALKPAWEPIIVAMKPLDGTFAQNALEHGVAGLWIDGGRIALLGLEDHSTPGRGQGHGSKVYHYKDDKEPNPIQVNRLVDQENPRYDKRGRWPANVILSHTSLPVYGPRDIISPEVKQIIWRYYDGYNRVQEMRTKREAAGRIRQVDLSELSKGIRGTTSLGQERQAEILLPGLQEQTPGDGEGQGSPDVWEKTQAREHRENETTHTKERKRAPILERRTVGDKGIHRNQQTGANRGATENSRTDVNQVGTRAGTPSCDGNVIRTPPQIERDSTPLEREQSRQQNREFATSGHCTTHKETSRNREGAFQSESRERTLEVFACDIPEWLMLHFEQTGEDLGCARVGTRRVKGGNDPRKVDGSLGGHTFHGQEFDDRLQKHSGFSDTDGLETVEAWDCVEGCAVRMLAEQSGERPNSARPNIQRKMYTRENRRVYQRAGSTPHNSMHNDTGTAARFFKQFEGETRFFYCAKASRSERDEGLEGMPEQAKPTMGNGIGGQLDQYRENNRNFHPTVKPLDLMRYLCRLTRTPTGGVVLDPFAGSGSTLAAAHQEGRRAIGIEINEEYCEIAARRIPRQRVLWSVGL